MAIDWERIKKNAGSQWDKLVGLGAEGVAQVDERVVPGEGKASNMKKDADTLMGLIGEAFGGQSEEEKAAALAKALREEDE